MPTMNLHPAFADVMSFADFADAYRANFPNVGGVNDLRRAWNLLVTIVRNGHGASRIIDLPYGDINVSQSSMRTAGSTLNRIFRNVGILAGRMRLANVDLHMATLDTSALNLTVLTPTFLVALQNGVLVGFRGRGQDRTTARHFAGHRRSRVTLRASQASNQPTNVVANSIPAVQAIIAAIPDFNPFEGIPENLFQILQAEAGV